MAGRGHTAPEVPVSASDVGPRITISSNAAAPSLAGVPADEAALVARIRAGDEAACEVLFRAYHVPLWRFAYGYVHSREVAEELVQDVFCTLWGERSTWDVRVSVRAWLYA